MKADRLPTSEYNTAKEDALKYYGKLVTLCRVIYKRNTNRLTELGLHGSRPTIYQDLYMQMSRFYELSLASPLIQNEIASLKVTREQLETGMDLLIDMEKKRQIQDIESDDAQAATRERNEALELLEDEMDDYSTILGLTDIDPEAMKRLSL